jgi:Protein of unknown function (DUF1294)
MNPALFLGAFVALNALTMLRFWQDKRRAIAGRRRIAEADLLGLALVGGSAALSAQNQEAALLGLAFPDRRDSAGRADGAHPYLRGLRTIPGSAKALYRRRWRMTRYGLLLRIEPGWADSAQAASASRRR